MHALPIAPQTSWPQCYSIVALAEVTRLTRPKDDHTGFCGQRWKARGQPRANNPAHKLIGTAKSAWSGSRKVEMFMEWLYLPISLIWPLNLILLLQDLCLLERR